MTADEAMSNINPSGDDGSDVLLAQTSIGQVSRVDVSSKVEVVWADNSMTIVLPQVRKCNQNQLITSLFWLLLIL